MSRSISFRFSFGVSFVVGATVLAAILLAPLAPLLLRELRIARQQAALEPFRKYQPLMVWDPSGYLEEVVLYLADNGTSHDLEQLKRFEHLRSLELLSFHFSGSGCTDATLASVAGLSTLKRLTILEGGETSKLTDVGLSHLANMAALTSLTYLGVHVTDAGMQHLERLREVETLCILVRRATDKGLGFLAKLDHLQEIALNNGQMMSGEGLAAASAPSKLKKLYILRVTDAGMRTITRFSNLRELSIGGKEITTDGFLRLHALPRLEKLSVSEALLDNRALEQSVAQLTWLKELHISKCPMSGDAFKHLRGLKELEVLAVSAAGIDDQSTPYLAELPNLRVLSLEGTGITNASMPQLLRLGGLDELSVPFSVEATPELRKELLNALPRLRRFKSPDGEIQLSSDSSEKKRVSRFRGHLRLPEPAEQR